MIFNDMGSSIDSLTHMGLLQESIIRCFNIILPINSDGITSNRSIYWQLATMNRICRRCTIYCRCKVVEMYLLTGLVTMTLPKGPKGIHQVSCHDFKLKQPLPFRHPHTWFCRRKWLSSGSAQIHPRRSNTTRCDNGPLLCSSG